VVVIALNARAQTLLPSRWGRWKQMDILTCTIPVKSAIHILTI